MSGSEDGRVLLALDGAIARITFDRPAARNAMTWAMYEQLGAACAEIARRDELRVAILRGAGGQAFIAGTDISQFQSFQQGEDGVAYEARIEAYITTLEAMAVPTIAVVEGWAVGGGMAIANACDLRLSTPGSRFGVPIARTLGNCLSAGNLRRLSATLGPAWVKRVLLTADMPVAEALPSGYTEIVAPERLEARVAELASQIAGHAPVTIRATREALRRLESDILADDTDLIRQVYGSADFREGVTAFVARRAPAWQGK